MARLLTYCAMSSIHLCMVSPLFLVMLYTGPVAALRCSITRSRVDRGSFIRFHPMMLGSSAYRRPLKVFTREMIFLMCALYRRAAYGSAKNSSRQLTLPLHLP